MEFSAFSKADKCPEESQLRRGPVIELPANEAIPASVIASLLDLLEQPILISDRTGRILQANARGKTTPGLSRVLVRIEFEFVFRSCCSSIPT